MPVPWLVLERGDERILEQLAEVALSHVGAAHVVVHAILASNDQTSLVRQHDDPTRGEVLVFVSVVAIAVKKRREPIAHRQ